MFAIPNVSRYKAAATHLIASALIAAVILIVMLFFWYPSPLLGAMGGKELILLIVGIDVCIGPLITLIIFNPKKKKLAFDLAVVACLQLAALGYGIHAMQAGRPVYMVFVENRLVVVSAAEIDSDSLAQAKPEFRHLPLTGPKIVAADMPTDKKAADAILLAGFGGMGLQNLPKFYSSYDSHASQVMAVAHPLDKLQKLTKDTKTKLEKAIEKSGRRQDELRYLPVMTKRAILTALIDARTGQFIGLLSINPAGQ